MTFHATRTRRRAKGHRPDAGLGHDTSPRISLSLKAEMLRGLTEVALNRGVPVAAIMREAFDLYLRRRHK